MKPGTELAADYALLKSMEWADIIRAVVVDKDDEYLHAVRRVLDDQAQRICEQADVILRIKLENLRLQSENEGLVNATRLANEDGVTAFRTALAAAHLERAEREGAAITDAAIRKQSWLYFKPMMEVGCMDWGQEVQVAFEDGAKWLRSESRQASADDPSAPSGVNEAAGEQLVPEMSEGEGNRRMKAMHYNVHDPQPWEGKE